jgi:hypothetical protein
MLVTHVGHGERVRLVTGRRLGMRAAEYFLREDIVDDWLRQLAATPGVALSAADVRDWKAAIAFCRDRTRHNLDEQIRLLSRVINQMATVQRRLVN